VLVVTNRVATVYGALTRLLDGPPPTLLWLVLAVPLSMAVLLAALAFVSWAAVVLNRAVNAPSSAATYAAFGRNAEF
jgi:hypothetical protein